MSEFQYYEWQTIDRLLTPDEQKAVNSLSSHIEVTPSRAVVTYDWSDFKHDPKQVLLKFFDAHFYWANWGSRELMFRFPNGLLDKALVDQYCDGEYVTFETIGDYQVLDINFSSEDSDWDDSDWMGEDMDASLSSFTILHADLIEGDYRLLYLAWLMTKTCSTSDYEDEEYDDEESEEYENREEKVAYGLEPPVPPGLKNLSPALQNFAQVFGIDPFIIQAAALNSSDLQHPEAVDYHTLISRLSRAECDDFLTRLAKGEAGVRLALRKRLNEFMPKEGGKDEAQPRSAEQLIKRAEQLEKAEAQRQAQIDRQKHIAEMKALAQKEPQVWQQVDDLLENGRKIASVYNEATRLLEKLKQLADFQDTRDLFFSRVRGLASKYGNRPSLMERWKQRGWI